MNDILCIAGITGDLMSDAGHGNKGDADTRTNKKNYHKGYDKIDRSKPVSTKGFKMKINGKEVK